MRKVIKKFAIISDYKEDLFHGVYQVIIWCKKYKKEKKKKKKDTERERERRKESKLLSFFINFLERLFINIWEKVVELIMPNESRRRRRLWSWRGAHNHKMYKLLLLLLFKRKSSSSSSSSSSEAYRHMHIHTYNIFQVCYLGPQLFFFLSPFFFLSRK